MRNIKDYKTFEAEQSGAAPLITSEEDLTNYYRCNKCGNGFYVFNDTPDTCNSCRSNEISNISAFDYFTDLKKGDEDLYSKELKKQKERGNRLVDLIEVGYQAQQRKYRRDIN
jgi:hypothetical protein